MARRILLTGAGGQLGIDVTRAAAEGPHDVDLIAVTRADVDVTDQGAVESTLDSLRPDVVIHAAAYTAVDKCESNSALAFHVNGDGTRHVVATAEAIGARVIYISTDYVFDGTSDTPYVESDRPNPASVYGASKLAGERAVVELGDRGLIVRTSWVCGPHGSNMVKTILRAAEVHPTLRFVDDQIGKPTFTSDLADALLLLATRDDSGIMHVTNEGIVSWFEFCQAVLAAAGLDPGRVEPCATHELQPPRPAPRPANSVLANTRFGELGLSLLRDFREPLTETCRLLTTRRVDD